MKCRGRLVGDLRLLAVDPHELGCERSAGGLENRLERPVLAGHERPDLAFAVDDDPDGHRLDATGRQPRSDLAPQQRAQCVADEAVDHAPCLLGVDEVGIDLAGVGERLANGPLRDLAERDTSGLLGRQVDRLGDVPGNRLAFAVEVGREVDGVGPGRGLADRADLLPAIGDDLVVGLEIVLDVDAELVLAGVLRQVADVTVRGEDRVARPEIAFDRLGLRGRLDDHEVRGHRGGV